MSSLNRTITGILWNSLGKLLEYVLLYVLSILIARGLGLYANGTYATLMSLTQMLLVFGSMGLETALNKHIPQIAEAQAEAGARYLLLRAVGLRAAIFIVGASVVGLSLTFVPRIVPPGVEDYLFLLIAYAGTRALLPLFSMTMTARFRTDIVAIVNVLIRSLELGAVLFLGMGGLTVGKLLALFTITGLCQLLAYGVLARWLFVGKKEPQPLRPFMSFGAVFWINAIVDYFLGRHGDIFFIVSLTGDSSAASLYDVAFSVVQLASLALTVGFGGVTFATFASLAVSSSEEMDRFYAFLVRVISSLTIPLYAFLVFHSGSVVHGLYSSSYAGAVALVQGIAWFRIAGRLFGGGENTEYLLARGFPGRVSTFGVVVAAVNITLDVLLIPPLGAAGAVIGSGVANVLANAAGYLLVRRRSPVHMQLVAWAKVTGVSILLSWGLSVVMPAGDLASVGITGAVLFAGVIVGLFVVKPFTAADVAMLQNVSSAFARPVRLFATRG
jgi:O-antigen/teichoic acid export membrane protein